MSFAYDPGGALDALIGLDPFFCPPLSRAYGRFYSRSPIRRTFLLSAVSIWLILHHLPLGGGLSVLTLILFLSSFLLPPRPLSRLFLDYLHPLCRSELAASWGHYMLQPYPDMYS